MSLVPRHERHPVDQSGGRNERILAFQCRILPPEFRIAASDGLCDIDLAVPLEEKENGAPLSVRKPLLRQQFLLGDNGVVDLPPLAFQIVAILAVIQVVNENIGIDQEVTFSHA
jgi:hypothetical protein